MINYRMTLSNMLKLLLFFYFLGTIDAFVFSCEQVVYKVGTWFTISSKLNFQHVKSEYFRDATHACVIAREGVSVL